MTRMNRKPAWIKEATSNSEAHRDRRQRPGDRLNAFLASSVSGHLDSANSLAFCYSSVPPAIPDCGRSREVFHWHSQQLVLCWREMGEVPREVIQGAQVNPDNEMNAWNTHHTQTLIMNRNRTDPAS